MNALIEANEGEIVAAQQSEAASGDAGVGTMPPNTVNTSKCTTANTLKSEALPILEPRGTAASDAGEQRTAPAASCEATLRVEDSADEETQQHCSRSSNRPLHNAENAVLHAAINLPLHDETEIAKQSLSSKQAVKPLSQFSTYNELWRSVPADISDVYEARACPRIEARARSSERETSKKRFASDVLLKPAALFAGITFMFSGIIKSDQKRKYQKKRKLTFKKKLILKIEIKKYKGNRGKLIEYLKKLIIENGGQIFNDE